MSAKIDIRTAVSSILNHDRVAVSWVCRAVIGADGKPTIDKFARIAAVYPKDGAGRLRVAVTDWREGEGPVHHVSAVSGYGYDKLTAALTGATVGGVVLGDHCDHAGRPTLRDLAHREGWEVIGSLNY
jgi:hypothetical protein